MCALAAGCGRYGFSPLSTDARAGDGAGSSTGDSTSGGGASGSAALAPTYAGAAASVLGSSGNTQSFTITPIAAGDALLMMVGCAGSQTPSAVTLTAPGWTFTVLSPLTFESPAQISAASFAAIVPSTAPVTATITFTGANCNRGKSMLADEFGHVDPSAPFDAHAETNGAGNCTTPITTGAANEAIWGGCYAGTSLTGPGTGYTMSASDGIGDFDEYRLTTDPAGTIETVDFANPNGFVIVAATLKPAP
jgi:hypothetical protein